MSKSTISTVSHHSRKSPPGPRGHWLFGNVAAFQADRLGFMRQVSQDFGGVVRLRLGFRSIWLVTDPAVIEMVLVTQARSFSKHFALRINPTVLGNGLLTSEGDFWLRQRRLSQPAFQRSQISHYAPTFLEQTSRLLETWRPDETRDVLTDMMSLTLKIVSKTLFGVEADNQTERVHVALRISREEFVRRLVKLVQIPRWIPTPGNQRLNWAVREMDAIVYGFIHERRASGNQANDLLGRLLAARDVGDETGMSDRQLRDECLTVFLAGHETTALALSWTWYLLGQNPEAAERIYQQVDNVLAGRSPTLDDIPQLSSIEHVLLESMRLYPPAFILGREALVDLDVGGFHCPRGTTLLMPQSVVHRDPRNFQDPDSFRPERWQNQLEKRLPKCAYFPFGAGPRVCIGNTFAMSEMTLVLARIAQQFQFVLKPEQTITPGVQFTLRPVPGVLTTVTPR